MSVQDTRGNPFTINPSERRTLGTTGVCVSRLGIGGGSSFLRAGDEGYLLVDAAWNVGLRYFDTAPLYGEGESELRFGRSLARRPRGEYVISTKVGRESGSIFDYSASGIRDSIRRSIDRMGVHFIDIAYIHDVDPDMHGDLFERRFDEAISGAYAALASLRDEGKINAIGVGLKDWNVALRLARTVRLDCIMLAGGYTLLQHGGLETLLPWCAQNQVSVIIAAPYNTGILASGAVKGARYFYRPAPPEIIERTRQIETICLRHDVPLAAAALQFPLHHPAIAAVVVGHAYASEIEGNYSLLRFPTPTKFWAELKEAGLIPAHAPTP